MIMMIKCCQVFINGDKSKNTDRHVKAWKRLQSCSSPAWLRTGIKRWKRYSRTCQLPLLMTESLNVFMKCAETASQDKPFQSCRVIRPIIVKLHKSIKQLGLSCRIRCSTLFHFPLRRTDCFRCVEHKKTLLIAVSKQATDSSTMQFPRSVDRATASET